MPILNIEVPAVRDVVLSSSAANLLMDKGSGNTALVYIYILSHPGALDIDSAASRLSLSADDVLSAVDTLSSLGLIGKTEAPSLPDRSDELPEYTQRDVAEHIGRDEDFKYLVTFCEEKLGKLLSTVDLQILLGIYSWLGLPIDVICLLVTSCIEETKKKYGEGRVPTVRSIEKRAKIWVRDGVMTCGRAEEYLREIEKRNSDKSRVAAICGIRARSLSPSEDRYISSWISLSLSDELISLAYDKTVINTGSLKWRYMDKILHSWHEQGIKLVSEAENRDAKPRFDTAAQGADLSAAERLRELNRKNSLKKE